MLPETIGGLPFHALIVHFTVVLLPVAAVGSLLTAVWPAVRRRFGWLTVAAAVVSTVLVPITTSSGDDLKEGLGGGNPLIDKHEALADMMLWWALGMTVAVIALMILHEVTERQATTEPDIDGGGSVATATTTKRLTGLTVGLVVAMLATVALSIGTGVHIYRVGDAGAHAVWQDVGTNLK
ncbi:MAG TPA: DUF2231 domain-containing protein [Actinophytocola sp.]|uniref:DUF2231 domain-containing protein n=1 Tax=Actinophytocola sp. TaxID=1872138 RepID=UPI002F9229FF